MKGLWVPLLVLWLTWNVATQQEMHAQTTGSRPTIRTIRENDAPLLTSEPFAAIKTQVNDLDQGPQPDDSEIDSTTTRQQANDPKPLPISITVPPEKLTQLRDDPSQALVAPLSIDGGRIADRYISGVVVELSQNRGKKGLPYRKIVGEPFYDPQSQQQALRFGLTDDDMRALALNRLRFDIPESERGKYKKAFLFSASAVQNANSNQENSLEPRSRVTENFDLTPVPGPAAGDRDFMGPVADRSPFSQYSKSSTIEDPRSNSNSFERPSSMMSRMGNSKPPENRVASRSNGFDRERPVVDWQKKTNQLEPLGGNYSPPAKTLRASQELDYQRQIRELKNEMAKRNTTISRMNNELQRIDAENQDLINSRNQTPARRTPGVVTPENLTPAGNYSLIDRKIARENQDLQEQLFAREEELRLLKQQELRRQRLAQNDAINQPGPIQKVGYQSTRDGLAVGRPELKTPVLPVGTNDLAAGGAGITDSRDANGAISRIANGNTNIDAGTNNNTDNRVEATRGQMQMMMILLFISLAINVYLGLLARSFYARYSELGEELRETFARSVTS